MSLIIKITQNGSSKDYLFNRPGPIVIGSDERCDLRLDDSCMEAKLLEVKMSGGKISIKELGNRSYVYLNSVILPYREEIPYRDGEIISVKDTQYSIQIHKQVEASEPPPFFEAEFGSRLDRMAQELKTRESDLKKMGQEEQKRRSRIQELEEKCHDFLSQKGQLEIEVNTLKASEENLRVVLKDGEKQRKEHKEQEDLLLTRLERMGQEERVLNEKILAANQSLSRLKEEREGKGKEMDLRRSEFSKLEAEIIRLSTGITELKREREDESREIINEKEKLHNILRDSDKALKDKFEAESFLRKLLNEKSSLEVEVNKIQLQVDILYETKKITESEIYNAKDKLTEEEIIVKQVQDKKDRLLQEEGALKTLNLDLRSEIDKAETRLRFKKEEFNKFDHECQDIMRKLTTAHFELERVGHHLKELTSEEETQNLRIDSLRSEILTLTKKSHDQKKDIQRSVDENKHKLSLELKTTELELETRKNEFKDIELSLNELRENFEREDKNYRNLLLQKSNLESEASKIDSEKKISSKEQENLRFELVKMRDEKSRVEKDLALLNIKFHDVENKIREREEEARVAIEDYKREERSKMLAEKEVLLSEVESFKQKSLIEVDSLMRKRQDEVWRMEEEVGAEARNRLKAVTEEAEERELRAHARMKEAHDFFKQKETEAHEIMQRSRLEANDLMKRAEAELLEDLSKRKMKIKKFLSMKQEQGTKHIRMLEDQHISRMKKNEVKGHQHIEHLKRKELKRIVHLKEEELHKLNELKENSLKEVNAERDKVKRQILTMKNQQETELADTKKKVLEHINHTKFSQQNNWEEDLKNQKLQFEHSKKARIENAAQAMMNLMTGDFNLITDDKTKDKIFDTLKMAIDGQSADALKHVGQVLDINPMLRKKMLPVIKKYALRFGLPAAVALVIMADVGSLRTMVVNQTKEYIRQEKSASDIFVKQQQEAWREKYTFNPPTTEGYKSTFTDNVLYTTNFEKVMDDEIFQNEWILKVHEFMVKELELAEDMAISYISSESTLIKELVKLKTEITPQFKDAGIAKLTAAEEIQIGWLKDKIADPEKIQKFADFRKKYYDEFYSTKFQNNSRAVANEPAQPSVRPVLEGQTDIAPVAPLSTPTSQP